VDAGAGRSSSGAGCDWRAGPVEVVPAEETMDAGVVLSGVVALRMLTASAYSNGEALSFTRSRGAGGELR
jgi:hypothetical protein